MYIVKYHKFLESKFNVIFKTPTDNDLKECAKMMNDYLTSLNINFGGEEAVDMIELSDILTIKDWNGISKDMIMQYTGQYQLLAIEK